MTVARSKQIDLEATPYYHIICRCVRRSYLCGWDAETGKDFSYRKKWLVDRLKKQANAFSIDIAAYAIMDNHYHLVLHVNKEQALAWSQTEVIKRWALIFPRDAKPIQVLAENQPKHPEVQKAVIKWRDRLISIPWFMRTINEYIARKCNQEDKCKGRFWEGRYKSQALLDEGALLSAMAYVDLNPIRAGMCKTPEESEFTSIQERIKALQKQKNKSATASNPQPLRIMSFKTKEPLLNQDCPQLEFQLVDYLNLIDQTGRIIRQDKKGAIPSHFAPILERINLNHCSWLKMVNGLENNFAYAVGDRNNLIQFSKHAKAPKGTKLSNTVYRLAS